ncbi:hypothetical protein [Phaffia rhodozyma]|uniref:Uncharacterized protein n=1 Tax=Phaffia rhodozyma TaxID=264483 RepID=A0A0F7SR99_PHARH|nr:hypothetical protein [Phaffia rhodozyma]
MSFARVALRTAAVPTSARQFATISSRPSAFRTIPRAVPSSVSQRVAFAPKRFASTGAASPVHSHTPMWIVLGVLVAGGSALFVYVKPIRELAAKAHTMIDTTKQGADQASSLSYQAASLAGLGPALAISQTVYKKIQEHGGLSEFLNGISNDLKEQDIGGALAKLKKVGGKEVEPFVDAAENALKEAKGKIGDVDWKSFLEKAQDMVGDEWKGIIKYVSQSIPATGPLAIAFATGDFSSITDKIKEQGGDQLKELEATAQKLYKKAQEYKDGKGGLEELFQKLQDADKEDLEKVLTQAKAVAKKAGIPADTIESWLADKSGKVDTENLIKQAKSYAESGAEKISDKVDTEKVVQTVQVVSPAFASLIALALSRAGVKLGSSGQKAAKEGEDQFSSSKKQLEAVVSGLKTASGSLSGDVQKRVSALQADLQKTLDKAPSASATADAVKESAKSGEKTSDAESKQKEWESALKKAKADFKKQLDGLVGDLEKAGGKDENVKKALELAKSYFA